MLERKCPECGHRNYRGHQVGLAEYWRCERCGGKVSIDFQPEGARECCKAYANELEKQANEYLNISLMETREREAAQEREKRLREENARLRCYIITAEASLRLSKSGISIHVERAQKDLEQALGGGGLGGVETL